MITNWLRSRFSKDDNGVSPVVGTILMVAATVAIGATVFAALNAFGGETTEPPVNAVFSVKAIDSDANGATDKIRVTYGSGPDLLESNVKITLTRLSDDLVAVTGSADTDWSVGESRTYDVVSPSDGTYQGTIIVGNSMVLDTTVKLDE